jgi:tyrosinase
MANNKSAPPLRVRRSLRELEYLYERGDKTPLENLMRAWKGIKELPVTDPNSFFGIGGYHGEPFRDQGATDGNYWGGFCNHNNILFPTWHRVYLYRIEEALRTIRGCEDVTLPYWDETEGDSFIKGVPWSLTLEKIPLDGQIIDNPIRSYKFQVTINDGVIADPIVYSKPQGSETVRYPFSGLVGTAADRQRSEVHNSQFTYDQGTTILNYNVMGWLNKTITLPAIADRLKLGGVHVLYSLCRDAPNYTVFSNNSSAAQWNREHPSSPVVVALETPHNDIHLSIGGFDVPDPNDPNRPNFSPVRGANGDMGENDTAAFDPVFFFHHCNVDRMFWIWQKKHAATNSFTIIDGYAGTNSNDGGTSAGYDHNVRLTLDSPLNPFINKKTDTVYTSRDCFNIEEQLGYTYTVGSLDLIQWMHGENLAAQEELTTKKLRVSNISRGNIFGSFVITAYATVDGEEHYIGHHSVFSRWNVLGCENCRAHLKTEAYFNLDTLAEKSPELSNYRIEITGRDEAQSLLNAAVADKSIALEIF